MNIPNSHSAMSAGLKTNIRSTQGGRPVIPVGSKSLNGFRPKVDEPNDEAGQGRSIGFKKRSRPKK